MAVCPLSVPFFSLTCDIGDRSYIGVRVWGGNLVCGGPPTSVLEGLCAAVERHLKRETNLNTKTDADGKFHKGCLARSMEECEAAVETLACTKTKSTQTMLKGMAWVLPWHHRAARGFFILHFKIYGEGAFKKCLELVAPALLVNYRSVRRWYRLNNAGEH